ncbi:MAG: hypothetical protein WDM76_19220 [Limisphaerales bacterium]
MNQNDLLQNLTNLLYSPRAPVFVPNPTNSSLAADFRFYLDLNRNGQFETNGWMTNLNNINEIMLDSANNPIVNFQVGDRNGSACWNGLIVRMGQITRSLPAMRSSRCRWEIRWI